MIIYYYSNCTLRTPEKNYCEVNETENKKVSNANDLYSHYASRTSSSTPSS